MRRRLFSLASAVSLLMCVATAVIWVRSYSIQDAAERFVLQDYENSHWNVDDGVTSTRGLILWTHQRHPDVGSATRERVEWHFYHPAPVEQDPEPWHNDLYGAESLSRKSVLGMSSNLTLHPRALREKWRVDGFYVLVPHRIIVTASLILPMAWVFARVRHTRRLGRCPTCSYDLTGNTSGVCPECGTAVAGKLGAGG
jgi:hypothetical protein